MNWHNLGELMARAGFEPVERPGMATFERRCSDGRTQWLSWFRWSNTKAADEQGVPRNYLVAVMSTNGRSGEDIPRLRIPLVEWPSASQPARPWSEVEADIVRIILPIFDAPAGEGLQVLHRIPGWERHLLDDRL